MKLKEGLITHETDGEQVMVDTDTSRFSGMVRSNRTAAFIVDQLKTETTREAIISAMLEKYDADPETVAADVDRILDSLRDIGVLEE